MSVSRILTRLTLPCLLLTVCQNSAANDGGGIRYLSTDSLQNDTLAKITAHTVQPEDSTGRRKKKGVFHAIGHVFTKIVEAFNDRDTSYIEPQHYNYAVMVQNTNTYEAYTIKSESGQSFTFAPKPSVKIGPYAGWRWVFLGYTFDITHLENSNSKREFDLSLYSSMLGIDIFYRKTGDNYRITKNSLTEKTGSDFLKNEPFSGLNAEIKGFDLYYIFNHRKFSYPAAFNQSTRQKRSCGSWLTGIGYNAHSLSLDYDALDNKIKEGLEDYPDADPNAVKLDEDFNFNSVNYKSFSVSVGYAYNWVFLRNCLFAASLSASVTYKKTQSDIYSEAGKWKNFNFENFNFDGIGRFGIVWNNDKWFVGASTILHSYNYKKSRFSTSSYFGSLNIYAGVNFGKRKNRKK